MVRCILLPFFTATDLPLRITCSENALLAAPSIGCPSPRRVQAGQGTGEDNMALIQRRKHSRLVVASFGLHHTVVSR